ncbi:hypothetical protein [Gloeocapsopsis crepidinum]|uniref:hypothetical protein n=1 Tax=Gloeocapsopsis crepidinum TaxID=693223 RepID=UPI00223FDB16|nr:hypothetical protein [Gloeocapsopsis crepidinum]
MLALWVGGANPGTSFPKISPKSRVTRRCCSSCSRLITVTDRGTSVTFSSVRVAVTVISIAGSSVGSSGVIACAVGSGVTLTTNPRSIASTCAVGSAVSPTILMRTLLGSKEMI